MNEVPHIIITPSRGFSSLGLRELWEYRELLYFLTWRNVKLRYKQTVIGAGWAIIQPFLTMIIFSIIFGHLAKVPSEGIPYPIFAYTALVPWQLLAFALAESGNSLIGNQHLITKVYFPRMIIPLSAILVGLLDFVFSFLVFIGMMLYYGILPTINVVTLPIFLLLGVITVLAVGLWLSALVVQYRDIRYIIPFLTQLWMFATPIAYPYSLVPEKWRLLYALNPMVGVVEGFRWALLGKSIQLGPAAMASFLIVVILLVSGCIYFRKTEKSFADVI